MTKNFLIIDGHSLAYRAFFSFPPNLTLTDGQPINAAYGFISLLFKGLEQFNPDYLCICFDRKEPTFRHKQYDQYKAHRPPAPQEFISQIPILRTILEKLSIQTIDLAGFEADDLMGTLSLLADKEGLRSVIMTGDLDSLQLVSDKTVIAVNKKGVSDLFIYTPEAVMDKYSLTPSQFIDMKALKGDTSDNIPGVRGIGEKTAINLLTQLSSLENIYENLDQVKSNSVRQKLETNKEMAFLSKELATICREAPIELDLESKHYEPDWNTVVSTFKEYDFNRLAQAYMHKATLPEKQSTETESATQKGDYHLITTIDQIKALLPNLKKGFAVDLETTSLNAVEAQIVGVSIAYKEKEAYYIALNDYLTLNTDIGGLFKPNDFKINEPLKLLKPLLEDPKIPKYTHNGKYEKLVFNNYGIHLKGLSFDTLLAAYILLPGEKLGLKALAQSQFNCELPTYEDITGKGKNQTPFSDIPLSVAKDYAGADSDFTLRLKNHFEPMIREKRMEPLFYDIEMPLQEVLADMERNGVTLDTDYLNQLAQEFHKDSDQLKKQIYELSECEFNINSTKQLAEILFDKLNLPVIKRTKTGVSTDSGVLEKLAPKHEIPNLVLKYRTYEKLLNTYVESLPQLISARTNRIHASFNQTVTITGRLSSSNPNLQNIPIRSEEGQKIRKAFIPSLPNNKILAADYSQIELRLMAALSKDLNMVTAFKNNEDIHKNTAALIFNIPLEDVTKEQRYHAKAVNFGIIYGQSAFGLSEQLGIKRGEAKTIIDNYFQSFPTIQDFINKTIELARENGYVSTEFGRIRPLPEINSPDKNRRAFAERTAVNTRLQGTAADIIKIAMIKIQKEIQEMKLQSAMLIQVHDELVFDVVPGEEMIMLPLVKNQMETAVKLDVPLIVEAILGQNWQEVK